ncbi:hypothetical protein [Corynebacterium alimapuense]|uniref:DUF2975 domain-containing protein n=1 Tax=Corynebacterium alimapuense TaxID=1576874 RepID=A0A3M8K8D2_9CORY|nr:hypothetical protein [Corynebacterium alimapuense]RNE49430.1 hypothetical protein C5L39_03445 [Corynebacterium alimapuense]
MFTSRAGHLPTWGAIVPFVLIFGLIIGDVVETVSTQTLDVAVAPLLGPQLDQGRVPFGVVEGGPLGYYLVGYAISTLALLVAASLLAVVAIRFGRQGGVTRTMARLVEFALTALILWGVGQFITHMGNNFAANTHDVLAQWDFMSTIDSQAYVLWLLIISVLSSFVYVFRRSAFLEEEQEGLV